MSHSITLYYNETKKLVHAAEQSSSWFREADSSAVVGAFGLVHASMELRSTLGQPGELDNPMDWIRWSPENCQDNFLALMGEQLTHLTT